MGNNCPDKTQNLKPTISNIINKKMCDNRNATNQQLSDIMLQR